MTEGDIVRYWDGERQYRVISIHGDEAVMQPCGESWVKYINTKVHALVVVRPGHAERSISGVDGGTQ